eukprot:g3892.t1
MATTGRDWCHFAQEVHRLPHQVYNKGSRAKFVEESKFCFLAIRRGPGARVKYKAEAECETAAERSYFWPRVVMPGLKAGGHVLMDVCSSCPRTSGSCARTSGGDKNTDGGCSQTQTQTQTEREKEEEAFDKMKPKGRFERISTSRAKADCLGYRFSRNVMWGDLWRFPKRVNRPEARPYIAEETRKHLDRLAKKAAQVMGLGDEAAGGGGGRTARGVVESSEKSSDKTTGSAEDKTRTMPKNAQKKLKSKRAQKKAQSKREGKRSGPNRKGGNRKLAKVHRAQKENVHKLLSRKTSEVLDGQKRRECDIFGSSESGDDDAEEEAADLEDGSDGGQQGTTKGGKKVSFGATEFAANVDDAAGATGEHETADDSSQHTAWATKLSHCEKSIRDKGFKSLQKWLRKKGEKLTPLDFVKLWRALFYCLWMSDKKPVQQALSVHIAQLTKSIPVEKLAEWCGAFFEVMQKEWVKLDTWRMNKFLLMVRIQLAEVFQTLQDHEWDTGLIESFNDVLLTVAPLCNESAFSPGFAQQVAACFWEEVMQCFEGQGTNKAKSQSKSGKNDGAATTGENKAKGNEKDRDETLLHLLEPWMQVLADTDFPDNFLKVVVREIFAGKMPGDGVLDEDGEVGGIRKLAADELFEIAKAEDLVAHKREMLMALVKQLQDKELEAAEVTYPEREAKLNPRLEAPRRTLRKGLGVRTRNQRKVRQRDKR